MLRFYSLRTCSKRFRWLLRTFEVVFAFWLHENWDKGKKREEGVPSSQFSRGQKVKNNLLKRTEKPTETLATQARGLENMEGRRNLVKASCAT